MLLWRVDGGGGLLLEAHAVLLHRLQLGLQRHDRRALGLDRLLGGGVRRPEVGDCFAVRRHCVVVVDCGHSVAVRACGDRRLVDERDLVRPKRLERVKRFDDAGGGGRSGDPALVLLRVQAASLDDADSDVDDVAIDDRIPCGVGIRRAREEAEGEGVKTVAGMPVGGHPLAIRIAIFRRRRTVMLSEPLKHVDENNVWFAEAPLLEGGAHTERYGVEENVREGSIHGDDVCPRFSV